MRYYVHGYMFFHYTHEDENSHLPQYTTIDSVIYKDGTTGSRLEFAYSDACKSGNHQWGSGINIPYSDTTVYTCTVCGNTRTETTEQHQHSTETLEHITILSVPKSVKAKAKKNKVTVSWGKIKKSKKTKALLAQIQGIELQYSTDPFFPTDNFVKLPLSKKKTKYVLKGLQRKSVYYVRVRYTDGAGGYSAWSKVKKVKTK